MGRSVAAILTFLVVVSACGHGDEPTLLSVAGSGGAGSMAKPAETDGPDIDSAVSTESGDVSSRPDDGSVDASQPVTIDATDDHQDEPAFPDSFFMPSNYGFLLRDSWFLMGCGVKAGHDCVPFPICQNLTAPDVEDRGTIYNETFPIGGELGTTYLVSFRFNGIAEGKYYQGGRWARADTDLATAGGAEPVPDDNGVANDTFYIGGTVVPSNCNAMRIRVLDPNKKEIGRYYMNAYPSTSGAESHRTFLLSYAHTIEVIGGGFVEYHHQSAGCHALDNCGPGVISDTECPAPRNIPNEPNVVLPAMYDMLAWPTQPHLVPLASLNAVTGGSQPWHAQISHITVTRVVAK
jgi:hypothetical protein